MSPGLNYRHLFVQTFLKSGDFTLRSETTHHEHNERTGLLARRLVTKHFLQFKSFHLFTFIMLYLQHAYKIFFYSEL